MFRTAFTIAAVPALILAFAPAVASGGKDRVTSLSATEQNAFARCQLRQPHMQTGKGLIFQPHNCRQIARAEMATLSPKQPLASREVGLD
ncbi:MULTISPECIES: hypothetical protein [unclassified Sphingomonas]|uniref:hypothetical protein n=1 Tax=unclassified Sphingomonas TaxID=196159 RepID=UPI001F587D71|nr:MULTISPECIES: hypothetical protein [unclassified Sphingomonas]